MLRAAGVSEQEAKDHAPHSDYTVRTEVRAPSCRHIPIHALARERERERWIDTYMHVYSPPYLHGRFRVWCFNTMLLADTTHRRNARENATESDYSHWHPHSSFLECAPLQPEIQALSEKDSFIWPALTRALEFCLPWPDTTRNAESQC